MRKVSRFLGNGVYSYGVFRKKFSKSDPEYAKRLNELLNDPEYLSKSAKRREELERMVNTPMRWYQKLPYWLVFVLIIYGLGKLVGFF